MPSLLPLVDWHINFDIFSKNREQLDNSIFPSYLVLGHVRNFHCAHSRSAQGNRSQQTRIVLQKRSATVQRVISGLHFSLLAPGSYIAKIHLGSSLSRRIVWLYPTIEVVDAVDKELFLTVDKTAFVDRLVRGLFKTADFKYDLIAAGTETVELADYGFLNDPRLASVEQN